LNEAQSDNNASSDIAIDAVGVTKLYDGDAGIRDLDLSIATESVVGLIGPSGAGKTTAVRLLTGLLSRDQGSLTVLGQDPEHFAPSVRAKMGYLPQDAALYPTLRVHHEITREV